MKRSWKELGLILLICYFAAVEIQVTDMTPVTYISKSSREKMNPMISPQSYQYIWDEYYQALGDLPGDDILAYGTSFGPFHNYTEIVAKIHAMNQTFPDIIDIFSIGRTYGNHDIWCVKLTDESQTTSIKSQILVVAQHHAREQITVENSLHFMDHILAETQAENTEIMSLLQSKEIFVIPSLNIDGASILHRFPWQRKTLRPIDEDGDGIEDEFNQSAVIIEAQDMNGDGFVEAVKSNDANFGFLSFEGIDSDGDGRIGEDNPGGVDPNRNYDYDFDNRYFSSRNASSQIFHGMEPFSENCTRILRDFVLSHEFVASVSLHSGIHQIYYPDITEENYKGSDGIEFEQEHQEVQNIITELAEITQFGYEPMYLPAGMFTPWIYFTQEEIKIAICLETFGNATKYNITQQTDTSYHVTGIWDSFNPPADQVIANSEVITAGLLYVVTLEYQTENVETPDDHQISGYSLLWILGTISVVGISSIFLKKNITHSIKS